MLFVESIARQYMPELSEMTKLSIACISTTNPVHLVFNKGASHPELVIRVAESKEVCKAHEVTEKLYSVVGGLVPKPVALAHFGGKNFAVQRGVKGTPWFQLSNSILTVSQLDALRERVVLALYQLHKGISSVDEWSTLCEPGQELRESLKECLAVGTNLSDGVKQLVEVMSLKLDALGIIKTFPQHGDFCLNNLIIDSNDIHVIDFEDFGMTSMPLFDEFSLALSMYSQATKTSTSSIMNEFKACTKVSADQLGIDSKTLPCFFMYHLLLRLGEWSAGDRREQFRQWLLSILEQFVLEPHIFFDDL